LAAAASKTSGIGGWTDDEIKRAITQGVAKDGSKLKPPMSFQNITPTCHLPISTPSSPICARCRPKSRRRQPKDEVLSCLWE